MEKSYKLQQKSKITILLFISRAEENGNHPHLISKFEVNFSFWNHTKASAKRSDSFRSLK
jgi:hypothetical protein